MNILVTGGAGFIGAHFIRFMLKKYPNYKIINVDALTYAGDLTRLQDIKENPHYHFIKCDICNQKAIEEIITGKSNNPFGKVDAIVHFAAESHVDRSISAPDTFVNTNIKGTHILLEAARKYKLQKFIQISTDEVYGSLGEEGTFTETSPLAPNSPYSASKAAADLLVRSYVKTYGIPACITRCSNNYGSYQHKEKLIPLLISRAIKNETLPIYGDGLQIRDWLHVKDHCHAIAIVLEKGIPGEIYNIGGNNEWTNIAVTKKILKLVKKPESLITFVKDRPGHDRRYAIDASKIKCELGWNPRYSFDEGLKETVEWYLENEKK